MARQPSRGGAAGIVAGLAFSGLGVALAPGRAEACSCVDPRSATHLVSPADESTGVPRNARILIGGAQAFGEAGLSPDARPLALFDVAGAVVPTTRTELSGQGAVVALHPEELLEAGARYEVRAGDEVLSRFSVGSLVDETAPAPPRVVGVETQSDLDHLLDLDGGGDCGPSASARFALDGVDVLAVAILDEDEGDIDAAGLSGQVAALDPGRVLVVGTSACTVSWPEARPLASANVRFGTYDLAGNFSGWSAPKGVVLPPPGCRCDASGVSSRAAPTGALALLLGLTGLFGFARRR